MRIVEDLDRLRSASLVASPTPFVRASLPTVQFIGHYYTNPGYSIERDNLDSCLLLNTISGTGYLHYRGVKHELKRGAVFLIDCRDYHLYHTDPDDLWEFNWVHIGGKTGQDYAEQLLKQGGPVVREAEGEITAGLERLHELMRNRDERSDLLGASLIVEMLTSVLLAAMEGQRKEERIPSFVRQIKTCLELRLRDSVSLDDLAREFSVSKYHLSREFKKFTGYSPYEYLINLRLAEAKELLKTTDLSVEEVAYRVGYTNVTHFIQTFKKREQSTPLRFRKVWQGV
jgi:AraC-like DNA-binding protein